MGLKINPLAVGNVLVVAACFAVVARIADPSAVWAQMTAMSGIALVKAVALHVIIIWLLAWRWRGIITALKLYISAGRALALTFTSTLLNLILPAGVGGDLGRVWMARRDGIDAASGSAAAVVERAIGVLSLVVMVMIPALSGQFADIVSSTTLLILCGAISFALALLAQSGRVGRNATIQRFAAGVQILMSKPSVPIIATTLSVFSHGISAVIAMVIAQGMGVDLSLIAALTLFPAVVLAGMMPVSVGGWGVRELAAVQLLAQAGIAAEAAIAIAIIFGVTQLIAAGLGTMIGLSRSAPIEIKQ